MTIVYFVRHAQPNYKNHDDPSRELTPKGMEDAKLVTAYFADKAVDKVLSSPFKRAMDTVRELAEVKGLPIVPIMDFRERKVDSGWIEDFDAFCKRQWEDFDFKLSDGETLRQVQTRNIAALNHVLNTCKGNTVVVGSHGTVISAIIHYYDPSFGYADFCRIQNRMPWIVKFIFDDYNCQEITEIDLN